MAKATILIVDDEADIRELVRLHLEPEGYRLLEAATGEDGLELVRRHRPDLVILDLMLPGIDGLEVCRRIKADQEMVQVAVIMLTAKAGDVDTVTGLEIGADDYVSKPFSGKVLLARVRAVLRRLRGAPERPGVLAFEGVQLDPERREVKVDGKPIKLTFTEFNILHVLARRPGRVFSRYEIVDELHGGDYLVTDRAVDVQIVSLRRKLARHGQRIETVRGVGYRFRDQP